MLLGDVPHHWSARPCEDAFALLCGAGPLTELGGMFPSIESILQEPDQSVLVSDSHWIAVAVEELEQSLPEIGS